MEEPTELRSKCFMRSVELLAKRVGCEPLMLIRWLEGRAAPPPAVLTRLRTETVDTSPQYFEVVDDPMESASGRKLVSKVDSVVSRLDGVLSWYTPVGVRRRPRQRVAVTPGGFHRFNDDSWCLVNKFSEAVSPWMSKQALQTYLTHTSLTGTRAL